MIGEEKLTTIQDLLKQGERKTVIARHVGVNRRTVYEIAIGIKRRRALKQPKKPYDYTRNKIGRCPGCGYKVVLPCLLCSLREGA